MTVRHDDWLERDGEVYGGFYYPPTLILDPGTGLVVSCEYIEIYLPLAAPERLVLHVLTHEYLHALAGRAVEINKGGIPGCSVAEWHEDGCEMWVQGFLPNPEGW